MKHIFQVACEHPGRLPENIRITTQQGYLKETIMNEMKNIVVYCGSNLGEDPRYHQAAQVLGTAIAKRGSRLVYGGGGIGLMGEVATAALAAGGEVTGVIPTFLRHEEMAHDQLTELIITDSMAERRTKMIDLADAFIALPGGLGTYEELFEVLSAAQLRLHRKPIGLLNINGFFNPLTKLLHHTAQQGFMPAANTGLVCVDNNIGNLLNKMSAYRYQDAPKWQRPAWQQTQQAT